MNNENEINENEVSEREQDAPADKLPQISRWKKIFSLNNVCVAAIVLIVIVIAWLFSNAIHRGAESAQEAYQNAKNKAAEDAYNKFYDTAFASAERKYHVSNHVTIEVASVREEANLEVLKVNDVEYVIEPREDTGNGIEVWMEFYGDGVYTVNMQASEFVIDSDRQYVLVRVPRPELTNCRITQANRIFWRDGGFNESNSVGTELAVDMRNAGYAALSNYMKSNAQFYKSAKSAAQTIISDLVKGLNSELPDLVVEVEFVE